ncbi:MAG: DNA polymerase III subunit alpha [Chlorobi bacterium]|nr:DNA polymerase III subunit alpha [Chlorobiota bacterium]
MADIQFTHLHVHSQYSILDGAASISGLVKKAKETGMTALALTDHGSMFGIKEFWDTCKKEGIKPILGCETYVARRTLHDKDKKNKLDNSGEHLILLAKNKTGYRNLLKLVSIANTEGFYYKPRIDKNVLEQYHEGLIVSSACLGGEVPQKIMKGDIEGAKETIRWFKNLFGDDYYLEVMYHPTDDPRVKDDVPENQKKVNKVVLELAKELDVKVIATNDVHFLNEEDADAHDILICLNTGKDYDDDKRMRYTKQEWLKTPEEMFRLFGDIPEVLSNTMEIADKVEEFELNSKPIMPDFPLPEGFDNEGDYLRYLTLEGAKKRYGDPIPQEALERINFELDTIIGMGFPGYFLITQDFINWAKNNGVLVGPGRGSAAGSAVAYCTGITNIDPIKHDLLFERFLNPDRISMPDIDIDFDDDGRQDVLDYVTEKYGKDKVAHICTFGTMATKSSIKDVARVLRLDLSESNRLAKLVPEAPKMSFTKAYKESPELVKEKESPNQLIRKTITFAESLEGSVRQTGVHACGILIGKDSLDRHLPVMPTKGEELLTTQYDGRFVEAIGLLKMDFLGLKTLSILKETIDNIRISKGIDINLEDIPGDDAKTFELFSEGHTTAIFQFESPGMKKYLKELKPNRFEDLVAMNALYRPGPMDYIPSFIARKHGREKIEYDHPLMEKYLKDTYGITVYQEQVMLLSRTLGGFTRGQSDSLRKAMGKKKHDLMAELKVEFTKGCLANEEFIKGCEEVKKKPEELIEKIWKDWEAFASYAFNKSHSVCYAHIAYQTGYFKAHYPAEFMAGVLSRNLNDINKIATFMEECRNMGLRVLGPDVNESYKKFTVNKKGAIRFGMAGIKGVGEGAVEAIIEEREKNGPFKDIYDFVERLPLTTVNKKNLEALAYSGALDNLGEHHRAQLFAPLKNEETSFIENLIRYGNKFQSDQANQQASLFGALSGGIEIKRPTLPVCEPFSQLEELNKEKEYIGLYLSAHPLDNFKMVLKHFTNTTLKELEHLERLEGKEILVGGMITNVREGLTKNQKQFAIITLEDYTGSFEFAFFGRDYESFAYKLKKDLRVRIKGKVQRRTYKKDTEKEYPLEVKVISITDLADLSENVKEIKLKIPLREISDRLIDDLYNLPEEENGMAVLKVTVYDEEKKLYVNMLSRKFRLALTSKLDELLEEYPDIKMHVN